MHLTNTSRLKIDWTFKVKVSRASTIDSRLGELLLPLGFKRKRSREFFYPLSGSTVGLLSLTLAGWGGNKVTDIFPHVGVCKEHVNKIVSSFRGMAHIAKLPTVGRPLRYSVPESERRDWVVTNDVDMDVIRDCARAVQQYGIPFIQDHKTVESMHDFLIDNFTSDFLWRYRVAVIDRALGNRSAAITILKEGLTQIGDRKTPADVEYRKFIQRFEDSPDEMFAIESGASP